MAVERILHKYNKKKKDNFESRHTRMTTYIANDLYLQMQALRETGRISSITALINAALKKEIELVKK